jgi:hypothetical protein
LLVEAFEGSRAETRTMIPTITAFRDANRLADVTVVVDSGMVSEVNHKATKPSLDLHQPAGVSPLDRHHAYLDQHVSL